MKGWRTVKISDFCDITRGGSPRPIHDFLSEAGTPWVKISDATESGSRYIQKTKEYIKPEGEAKSRVVYPGDFILSNSATPGLPRFMKIRACIHDGWLLIRNIKDVDELFLYYLLLTEREALLVQGNGSIFTNLKTEILKEHKVLLPPLPEQKAIASVLSSLDDKIDLLHRQNKTLEAMAETLFRQWFVEEADEGWEEVTLGDFFPVVTGKRDANFGTDDGLYPFFTCSQNPIKAPEYSFDGSAILLAGNGDFNIKRYVGKFEAYQRTYVLIPSDITYFNFLYTLMKFYLSEITGGHQGSVINFITKGMITGFKFNLPRDRSCITNKLFQFNQIFEKIDNNSKKIRTLEKLRDTLLPKLMAGEVRVDYKKEAAGEY